MECLKIHYVRNQLDPLRSTDILEVEAGRPLRAYMAELHPLAPAGFDIVACINGRVVAEGALDLVPLADDSLVVTARPMGGGGGGKDTWRIVAMVVVMVVATVVTWGAAGVIAGTAWGAGTAVTIGGASLSWGGALAVAAVSAAVTVAGSMAVNALIPPTSPDFGGPNNNQGNTPTYGWEPGANAVSEGVTLPVLYGRHRVAPPIVARYVETAGNTQYLNVLMAVADHELAGIDDVRINDQPVSNYRSMQVETRPGAVLQSPVQHFGDLKADVPLQVKLSTSWAAREIPGNSVQGLGICILCPGGLYRINDKGNFESQLIRLCIEMRRKGETEWTRLKGTNLTSRRVTTWYWSAGCYVSDWNSEYQYQASRWVEMEAGSKDRHAHADGERYYPSKKQRRYVGGILRSRYEWRWVYGETIFVPGELQLDYVEMLGSSPSALRKMFWFEGLEAGEYEVRVRFAEQPPTGQNYGTDAYLEYAQTVITDDFCYPGTALLAVRALATDQLSGGLPRITCLAERATVQVWNPDPGAYEAKPANNPAWACYDLLHNETAGNVPAERILYPAFAAWAEWCADKGLECNIYLDSPISLRKALDMLSTLGRGTVVQMGSLFTCIADRPWTAPMPMQRFLFTMGNMVADSYREEFLAYQERANAVEITYFDAGLDYTRQSVEVYQDGFDISSQGIKKRAETLFGCTSRSQALAHARALLRRNRYLSLTVSFDADADAIACLPGDVIDVSHDVPQWGASGRILSATTSMVELDREVTLQPGKRYVLQLKHGRDDGREEVAVAGVSQETRTSLLSLDGLWADGLPQAADLYAFGEMGRASKAFRVLSLTRSSDLRRRITALEYMPEIYEDSVPSKALEPVNALPAVENLEAREIWAMGPDGSGRSCIDLSWRGTAMAWQVFLREADGQWQRIGQTFLPSFRVDRPLLTSRKYEVAVSSTDSPDGGKTASLVILGKGAPPSNVTGFLAWADGEEVAFRWEHIPDMDLWGYEIRQGDSWETGLVCVDGVQENSARWRPPAPGSYTFWLKALDASEHYSPSAAKASVGNALPRLTNVVLGRDELPDGVSAASLKNLVWLPQQALVGWIPGLTDADFEAGMSDASIPDYAGDALQGVYTSPAHDLGAVADFTLRLSARFRAMARGVTDQTYPQRTDQVYPLDTDSSITSLSTYRPEYRCSEDGQAWTAWALWTAPADCRGRQVQVRVKPVLDSAQTCFGFTSIKPLVTVPDQRKTLDDQAIPAEGATFALADLGLTFLSRYTVGVTVLGSSPLTPMVDRQSDRFSVQLFNSSGVGVAGLADIDVGGF